MRCKFIVAIVFLMVSTSLSLTANGETKVRKTGPHGGEIIEDSSGSVGRYEVRMGTTPENNQVDVYLLDPKKKPPPSNATIKIFGGIGQPQVVQLEPVEQPRGLTPHYQGRLDQTAGSYSGFEVSFGFDPIGPPPVGAPSRSQR